MADTTNISGYNNLNKINNSGNTSASFSSVASSIFNYLSSSEGVEVLDVFDEYVVEKNWAVKALFSCGASVVNGGFTIFESLMGLVDGVFDTIAVATTLGGSVVTVLQDFIDSDLWNANYDGIELNETKALWEDMLKIIDIDIQGEIHEAFYGESLGLITDRYAHDLFKEDGLGCSIVDKGVKVFSIAFFASSIAASYGTDKAVSMSRNFSSIFTGIDKFFDKLESIYTDSDNIGQAISNATLSGLLEAGTWFLTYAGGFGKVAKNLGEGNIFRRVTEALWSKDNTGSVLVKGLRNFSWGDEIFKAMEDSTAATFFTTFKDGVSNIFSPLVNSVPILKNVHSINFQEKTKMAIQFFKAFAQSGIDDVTDVSEFDFNKTFEKGFTNAAVSLVYDQTFSPIIDKIVLKHEDVVNVSVNPQQVADSGSDILDDINNMTSSSGDTVSDSEASDVIAKTFQMYNDLSKNLFKKSGGTVVKEVMKPFVVQTVEPIVKKTVTPAVTPVVNEVSRVLVDGTLITLVR